MGTFILAESRPSRWRVLRMMKLRSKKHFNNDIFRLSNVSFSYPFFPSRNPAGIRTSLSVVSSWKRTYITRYIERIIATSTKIEKLKRQENIFLDDVQLELASEITTKDKNQFSPQHFFQSSSLSCMQLRLNEILAKEKNTIFPRKYFHLHDDVQFVVVLVVVCDDDGHRPRLRRLDRLGDEGALAALHQRHRALNIVGIEEGAAAAGGVAGDQGDARVSVVLEGGKRNCEFIETKYSKNNSAKNNNSSSGGSSSSYNNNSSNNSIKKTAAAATTTTATTTALKKQQQQQ